MAVGINDHRFLLRRAGRRNAAARTHSCSLTPWEGQPERKRQTVLIGELAKRTGTSERLLRYYERVELLRPERRPNGYRTYDETAPSAVLRIRALLAAGLPTASSARSFPAPTPRPPYGRVPASWTRSAPNCAPSTSDRPRSARPGMCCCRPSPPPRPPPRSPRPEPRRRARREPVVHTPGGGPGVTQNTAGMRRPVRQFTRRDHAWP
ncbi:MerR family transcriptional regulator [Streptomyces yokosukanensis]|uniref:MerR family transcriptional regulator n=1 Tax=Streptomyces yokosukanensis TaxID=67386 RepID=UPI003F4D1D0A